MRRALNHGASESDRRPRALVLGPPDDNVAVAVVPLIAGERLALPDGEVVVAAPVQFGHKVATRAIAAGSPVFKYGEPIGIATADIAPGEHVHVHNLASGRLPGPAGAR
jgi:altronate hydrolase